MTWLIDGKRIRSVLVSRQRYLGDIVMSTVVLEALRRGDSEMRIGFLCETGYGAVLAGQEGLDDLHLFSKKRTSQDAKPRTPADMASFDSFPDGRGPRLHHTRNTLGLIHQLRTSRYDLVVDLFFNPFSAFLFKLAGIPKRIGGTSKWRRRLYTHTVTRQDPVVLDSPLNSLAPGGLGEHLCRLAPLVNEETGLSFLQWLEQEFEGRQILPLLSPRIPLENSHVALQQIGVGQEGGFLLLAPGATWPSKEWPLENWRALVRNLIEETSLSLVLILPPTGSGRWAELAKSIPVGRGGALPVLNLSDALDVVSRCYGLVSVDGGTLHAGVGLGRPTIGLFGPTDPAIWFPYSNGGPFCVLGEFPACHPCDLHECNEFICMPPLTPETVTNATMAMLREWVPSVDGNGADNEYDH